MTTLARISSYLLHPLLMLTYLVIFFSYYMPGILYPVSGEAMQGFILIIFLMTFAIPMLGMSFFKMFGLVQSLKMEDRKERILPFFFTSLFYVIVTYLFYSRSGIRLSDNVLKLLTVVDCLVLCGAIVTVFYKISMHAVAMCGVLGILLPLNRIVIDGSFLIPTVVVIVLTGIVGSSRLQLNAHTPREVLVGSVVGFAVGFFGMFYWF